MSGEATRIVVAATSVTAAAGITAEIVAKAVVKVD